VQAQATRFGDTAALYQALGGGWWNRKGELTSANDGVVPSRDMVAAR
jgi:outer membrane protein TolC